MRNRIHAVLGARIHLGLSKDGVAIVRKHAGWRKASTLLADLTLADHAVQEPQRIIAQCGAILSGAHCAGLPLCVTLSDDWVRLFMVTPPQNCGRLQDLQAATAMRFQALYGEAPTTWQLEADWHTTTPFLVCAMPRNLLAGLQQLADANKLSLLSIQPQFIATWNHYRRALPAGSWFGIVQEQSLTLGAIAPTRRLDAVRSLAIPDDGHDPRWLQEQIARVALQLNLSTPGQLHLVGNHQQYWNSANPAAGTLVVRNLDKLADQGTAASFSSLSPAVTLTRSTVPA